MESHSSNTTPQETQSRTKFDKNLLALIKEKRQYGNVKSTLRRSNIWNAQDKHGNTLLHIAAKHNNENIAQYLIKFGSKVDVRNNLGKTPLIVAIENSSKTTTETLLEAANIYASDYSNKSALQWVLHAELFGPDIIQAFLDKIRNDCSNDNEKIANTLHIVGWPLHYVVLLNKVDITRMMLERGCQVDARDRRNQTALHKVVQSVDVEQAKLLLERNADPDAMDYAHRSPLHYLYNRDQRHSDAHLQILKMLINRGAAQILTVDDSTWRQVDLALRFGNRETIEFLLDANLRLNSKDAADNNEQNTPIHLIARNQGPRVIRALDNRVYLVNVRNAMLRTPMWVAALYGNVETVEYLLKRGADVNAVDRDNCSSLYQTAYYYYSLNRGDEFKQCLKLLLEYGADSQLELRAPSVEGFTSGFDIIGTKLAYDLSKIVIAHLVVREAHGTEITEHSRKVIDGEELFKDYYDSCRQQLSKVVDKNVTLLDLLSIGALEFEKYVRHEEWASKMRRFCSDEKTTFTYLDTMLRRRIGRIEEIMKLKMDAACVVCGIMEVDYSGLYFVADRIVSYLSELDFENLLQVPLQIFTFL